MTKVWIGPLPQRFSKGHRGKATSEQGFRACLGILSLTRSYDNARRCRLPTRHSHQGSLRRLDHGNIRGQGYFH